MFGLFCLGELGMLSVVIVVVINDVMSTPCVVIFDLVNAFREVAVLVERFELC